MAKYPSELPNKYYDHSTNKYEPGQPFDEREGTREPLKITGRLTTDKVDVLVVDNPNSSNEIPHITLATAEGVKPFESNAELQKHRDEIVPLDDVVETEFRNNLGNRGGRASFSLSGDAAGDGVHVSDAEVAAVGRDESESPLRRMAAQAVSRARRQVDDGQYVNFSLRSKKQLLIFASFQQQITNFAF